VKTILRREGINRKGVANLEHEIKRRRFKKKKKVNIEKDGLVHQVYCKDYKKMYIGETKFTIKERRKQHNKDVEFGRTNISATKPSYCHLPVSCRSLVDRCGSLGSCMPQI
jgi:hypothetical protein